MTENDESIGPKFYFKGKFFTSEKDFYEYAKTWQESSIEPATIDLMLEGLKKNILVNACIREIKCTNREFEEYIQKLFLYAMKEMPALPQLLLRENEKKMISDTERKSNE